METLISFANMCWLCFALFATACILTRINYKNNRGVSLVINAILCMVIVLFFADVVLAVPMRILADQYYNETPEPLWGSQVLGYISHDFQSFITG
ncbi:MAG: hypothetical protein IJ660_05385 [Alphaproteobacteria bacterium]|nr:hypothetical protein [Alphaproteobacteria bacterium]